MYVASVACRKDIIVSALGQSQPVDKLSLKKTTLIRLSSAIAEGATYGTFKPLIRITLFASPKV